MEQAFASQKPAHRVIGPRHECTPLPMELDEAWLPLDCGKVEVLAVINPKMSVRRIAEADGPFKHRVEHRPQVAW